MKKSTKKVNAGANKNRKQTSEDSSSKIKSYFKSAPKSFVVEDKNNHVESSTKDIYIKFLNEKLEGIYASERENLGQEDGASAVVEQQEEPDENILENHSIQPNCDKGACAAAEFQHVNASEVECPRPECEQKRKECKEWQEKYKDLKKLYVKLTVHHSELDLKHKDLSKVVARQSPVNNDDESPADGDIFTESELKFLKCMPLEKKKDSTFVLQSLQFAYKSEPSVLVNKSLKGTRDWIEFTDNGDDVHHAAKQPLSPHKVERIKKLFLERIEKCQINSVEYGERVKEAYIHKLIGSGIKNISKKQH